jgi:hypothetical protein
MDTATVRDIGLLGLLVFLVGYGGYTFIGFWLKCFKAFKSADIRGKFGLLFALGFGNLAMMVACSGLMLIYIGNQYGADVLTIMGWFSILSQAFWVFPLMILAIKTRRNRPPAQVSTP